MWTEKNYDYSMISCKFTFIFFKSPDSVYCFYLQSTLSLSLFFCPRLFKYVFTLSLPGIKQNVFQNLIKEIYIYLFLQSEVILFSNWVVIQSVNCLVWLWPQHSIKCQKNTFSSLNLNHKYYQISKPSIMEIHAIILDLTLT